jgi:hypothetical protein
MRNTAIRVLVVGCVIWLSANSEALAQLARPFERQNAAYATYQARPTVSPYLNLTDNNGLSNYQALVRPLIEEREELNRQWSELDQISRQVRGVPLSGNGQEPGRRPSGGRGTSVRFMHYSHYFGSR